MTSADTRIDSTTESYSRGAVSAQLIAGIVNAASTRGAEVDAALARAGIDPALLEDPEARIPVERQDALWEELTRATGDPCFGLHAQLYMPAGAADVLDFAVRSSPTLHDAFTNLIRFNRLAHDLAEFSLEREGDVVRLVQRFRSDPIGATWQGADYTVGGLVVVIRQLIGDEAWSPLAVRVCHARPDDVTPYLELLGVEPVFGGSTNELHLEAAMLERPVRGADPRLNAILTRHAEELLERLPSADDIVSRARQWVAEHICGGDVQLDAVAAALDIGPRTLQRRLREAGTSHQNVVSEIRRDMAASLLRDGGFGASEVAFALGYSEPSAFYRAFKRWHGVTPAEYQRRDGERSVDL